MPDEFNFVNAEPKEDARLAKPRTRSAGTNRNRRLPLVIGGLLAVVALGYYVTVRSGSRLGESSIAGVSTHELDQKNLAAAYDDMFKTIPDAELRPRDHPFADAIMMFHGGTLSHAVLGPQSDQAAFIVSFKSPQGASDSSGRVFGSVIILDCGTAARARLKRGELRSLLIQTMRANNTKAKDSELSSTADRMVKVSGRYVATELTFDPKPLGDPRDIGQYGTTISRLMKYYHFE